MAYLQLESPVKCKKCKARLSRVTLEHNCYNCGNDLKKEVEHNQAVHVFLVTAPAILFAILILMRVLIK